MARNAQDARTRARAQAFHPRGPDATRRTIASAAADQETPLLTPREKNKMRKYRKENPTAAGPHRTTESGAAAAQRGGRQTAREAGDGGYAHLRRRTAGGAGWSGGSDPIRRRRRKEGDGVDERGGNKQVALVSQIRPGRSARRAGPRAGPFIAPPRARGAAWGGRRRIGFGRIGRSGARLPGWVGWRTATRTHQTPSQAQRGDF